MESYFDSIYNESQAFGVIEVIAVVTALIYVVLAAQAKKLCFAFGLISSAIYVYLATELQFYFDSVINLYYVLMSFYGWFAWSKQKNLKQSGIQSMSKKMLYILLLVGLFVTIILAFSADRFSSASLPYLDAFTTVFAIIATWMVIKKYIENWLIWIIVDLIAMGMYFYKGLILTSFLFGIYTVIASFGYFKWKKQLIKS